MKQVPEIMATIGPTLEKPEDLRKAVEAGARWFRLPCGYRQRPHLENARDIRAVAAEVDVPVRLLLDLPSSRPRTGAMKDLQLETGARILLWDSHRQAEPPVEAGAVSVPLPQLHGLLDKIAPCHRVWFCDARLEFIVEDVRGDGVLARLNRGAIPLKASNSIYLPDSASPFTMVTEDDLALLDRFAQAGVVPDWVALSLISTPEDVVAGRAKIDHCLGKPVCVMAKIETQSAVDRVESILEVADGAMVARGDLGPAVRFIGLPEAEERIVAAARRARKPVVVATQILEYYAENGIPLRSEISGLSLIARENPDAIMFGKETVFSPRPIDCIRFATELLTYETRRLEAERMKFLRPSAASMGRPFLVAIEGPNGAGKTLLCSMLGQALDAATLRGVPAGWEDSSLKLHMIRDADWLASAMYFLSGVIESSRQAALSAAKLQVMDRSLWSTLAVHYAHDPARMETLLPLFELAADRLAVPELTLVLEADAATCRQRIARKSGAEQELDAASPSDEAFHLRERQFYHWLSDQGLNVVFLDTNSGTAEDVCRRAVQLICGSLPCCC
ncbi:MAG: pyruvate kinase [Thermoguttaceae bacterium]|jgi:pyruvate kinase/thymidylate kinase